MNSKNMKLPLIILAIGLVFVMAVCAFVNIKREPVIKTQDFDFSITYSVNGEVKTLNGVYTCTFEGHGDSPLERIYSESYTVDGISQESRAFLVAEKDGYELSIIATLEYCYLLNDKLHDYYNPYLEDPEFEILDREGYYHDEPEVLALFNAEMIDWEYPEPVDNRFVFCGFTILHTGSMVAMTLAWLLVAIVCLIVVKKDKSLPSRPLDTLTVLVSFATTVLAIPFLILIIAFFQITMSSDDILYQIFLCIPSLAALGVTASICLRRRGYSKSGFFVQLITPALFVAFLVLESVIYGLA